MMVVDMKAKPIIEQIVAANAEEGEGLKAHLAYMQSGGTDKSIEKTLFDRWMSAHETKMKLFQQLEVFKLDKKSAK